MAVRAHVGVPDAPCDGRGLVEHPLEGGLDVPRGDLVAGGDVLKRVEAAPSCGPRTSEAGGHREGPTRGRDGPSDGAGDVPSEETVPLIFEIEAVAAGLPCEVSSGDEGLDLPVLARRVDHAVGQGRDVGHRSVWTQPRRAALRMPRAPLKPWRSRNRRDPSMPL